MPRHACCTLALLIFVLSAPIAAQTPRFEIVSVKPCKPDAGGGRGAAPPASPGRLALHCMSVGQLIRMAYTTYAGGHLNLLLTQSIEGGPAWIESEFYEVDAKAETAPGQSQMRGPMLQALLEDRFHLRMRRVSHEAPAYALTVAKGGIKLQPSKPGDCVPPDYGLPTPYPQFCGAPKRGDPGLHLIGATMVDLCRILSAPEMSDLPVIDRTGLTGMFDIHLPGPGGLRGPAAQPDDSPFDAIRSALRQLGLNLERTRGSIESLIIDHIERPSTN